MTFLPFWHSKFSFIANSLLIPHRKAPEIKHENRLEIGRKSAISRKNRNHSLHSLAFCGMLHWIWSEAVSTASLYTECHQQKSAEIWKETTNSVEIVASDTLTPSWWCFRRFSTTNAGLKSRLRHRICQKHSRKCVNFLQFYILNKILHANYGHKFYKKNRKKKKIRNRVFSVILTTCQCNFPPPPPP